MRAYRILFLLHLISIAANGQQERKKQIMGIGIKAGINFANITKASSVNNNSRTGFLVGAFINPATKGILGSSTEISFSRQGYDFSTSSNTGNVNLNYILFSQLIGFNLTRFFQIQVGAQTAYLINAKNTVNSSGGGMNPYGPLLNYYNRFDYGAAGGVEIRPVKNIIAGARYNISFGKLYKENSEFPAGPVPPFVPNVDVKNNVFQLFVGLRF